LTNSFFSRKSVLINILIILFHSILIAIIYSRYQGSFCYYLFFTISTILMLIIAITGVIKLFELFFVIYLWLGFWFKYSINIILNRELFWEVKEESFNWLVIDGVLYKCSLVFLIISLLLLISKFINFPSNSLFASKRKNLSTFYKRNRFFILFLYFIFVLSIASSNLYYGIYQRGFGPSTILPFGLNLIYPLLLLIMIPTLSAIIVQAEIDSKLEAINSGFLIQILESLLTNISILSRGMIVIPASQLIGIVLTGKVFNKVKFALMAMTLIITFSGSVIAVNYFRISLFGSSLASGENNIFTKYNKTKILDDNKIAIIPSLLFDRWVGIEGMVAVDNINNRGLALWYKFWQDKLEYGKLGTYDREIINSPYWDIEKSEGKKHSVSLPGAIAFLYVSDSFLIVIAGLFIIFIVGNTFEFLSILASNNNILYIAFVCQVVAYRFAQFGYAPSNSWNLFCSIIISLIIIFLSYKLINSLIRFKVDD